MKFREKNTIFDQEVFDEYVLAELMEKELKRLKLNITAIYLGRKQCKDLQHKINNYTSKIVFGYPTGDIPIFRVDSPDHVGFSYSFSD